MPPDLPSFFALSDAHPSSQWLYQSKIAGSGPVATCSYFSFKCYCITSITAPQDAHRRSLVQVYLGSNTLEFSAIRTEKLVGFRKQSSLLLYY